MKCLSGIHHKKWYFPILKRSRKSWSKRLREHSKVDKKESSNEEESQEESIEGGEKNETPKGRRVHGTQAYITHFQKTKRPSQLKTILEEETWEPQLRKSKRTRKSNPKYTNAVLVERPDIQETSTYEEECQKEEWQKAMEKKMQALTQNKVGS